MTDSTTGWPTHKGKARAQRRRKPRATARVVVKLPSWQAVARRLDGRAPGRWMSR